jgi:hypothetical protein
MATCLALALTNCLSRPAAAQEASAPPIGYTESFNQQCKRGLFFRIRHRLARWLDPISCPCEYPGAGTVSQSTDEPKLAYPDNPEMTAQSDNNPEAMPRSRPILDSLKKEYVYHIGHADDYTWVTGQLFYVHAGNGMWVIRYATADTEDRYGGSVVLAPAVNMKNFREGDLVSVEGEILNEGRASKNLGGPSYRATHVELIERADQ